MRRHQFLIAAVMAILGIVSFYSMRSDNPITGERQSVGGITAEEEIALGLQAAPQVAQEFGGLEADAQLQSLVKGVGSKVRGSQPDLFAGTVA